MTVNLNNGVCEDAKNSNPIKKISMTEIAKPSIPSIKFIALIIETMINIVRTCDANLPIS